MGTLTPSDWMHFPAETSQVVPWGQQCLPSEQQTALGSGQHPYPPEDILQHVWPLGHSEVLSGQMTFSTLAMAVVFVSMGTLTPSDWMQAPAERSQEAPCGQQWTWSEQQTACGDGQQPYLPEFKMQQVVSLGHSAMPSGHSTTPASFACGTFGKDK